MDWSRETWEGFLQNGYAKKGRRRMRSVLDFKDLNVLIPSFVA